METDKKRIGVGNSRFPNINEEVVPEPIIVWQADSEIIYADSTARKVDEDI